jgi:hypothetical protein
MVIGISELGWWENLHEKRNIYKFGPLGHVAPPARVVFLEQRFLDGSNAFVDGGDDLVRS